MCINKEIKVKKDDVERRSDIGRAKQKQKKIYLTNLTQLGKYITHTHTKF